MQANETCMLHILYVGNVRLYADGDTFNLYNELPSDDQQKIDEHIIKAHDSFQDGDLQNDSQSTYPKVDTYQRWSFRIEPCISSFCPSQIRIPYYSSTTFNFG
jgi:hypothetical protein